jgi:hypothetical protein
MASGRPTTVASAVEHGPRLLVGSSSISAIGTPTTPISLTAAPAERRTWIRWCVTAFPVDG